MPARRRVHFTDARERPLRQPGRQPNQCGPEPLVNEGDLALDGATDQDSLGVPNRAGDLEDPMAAGMGPPAAADPLARDGLCERRDRPLRRLENDAVLANEGNSFARGHQRLFGAAKRPAASAACCAAGRLIQTVGTVPPSMTYSAPVIEPARADTRKATRSATSAG